MDIVDGRSSIEKDIRERMVVKLRKHLIMAILLEFA